MARIVVAEVQHHVTQRGNRRQPVLFAEADYAAYRDLPSEACVANRVLLGSSL